MAIFGGKVGDYEFHSIIGVIKGIINHKYDENKKKIELRKLSAEADLAEQQALKQKLEKYRNYAKTSTFLCGRLRGASCYCCKKKISQSLKLL